MEGSRCQRLRQMWTHFSLHKWMRNGTILTEPRWTLVEALGNLKGQERLLLSQVGQKKEEGRGRGEEVDSGLKPCREMKLRRGLHIGGSPSVGWSQFGQEESLILCEERTWQPGCGSRTEWELNTGHWCQPCPPSHTGMCTNEEKRAAFWNMGFVEQTQAADYNWQWGNILKGWE